MNITTHQLAKLLLESEDKPFTVSVDISVYGKKKPMAIDALAKAFMD